MLVNSQLMMSPPTLPPHSGGWWRGDYGRKKKKWFPANYVEEIDTADPQAEAEKQLGNLQQGAIDIAGTTVVL